MKLIRFIILILLFTHISYLTHSQCSNLSVNAGANANLVTETLYEETFAGQNGKGAIGVNPIDLVGCNWTIDVSSANLSDIYDYFKVYNEKLEARDVDGMCYWYSPIVNIQNYINVNLSLVASQISNSNRYEATDVFYSEYSLDGNVWTYFTNNGQMTNGFSSSSVNVSQNGLKGSTVQIRVSMNVNEDNEKFKLDDIKVTGQEYKINLCYGDPLTLGGLPTANWSGTGNPSITYQWTPTSALSDPNISNPIAIPTTPIIYKVVSTLTNNGVICKDSSLFYVNVTPQVSISSSSPVCSNDTLTISEQGGNATSWTWTSNGNATIISSNNSLSQVVGMVDGEIFSVYIEDDDGCSNTATTTIQVNPKPTNVTSSDYGTYCSSSPVFPLTGGSPAGGYYSGVGVSNNNYDASSVGYGSSIENVDILYIYSDVNGCKDTSISQVTVQKAPDVELTSSFLSLAPTNTNYIIRSPNGEWSKCGNPDPTFNLQMNIDNLSVANNSANINYDIDYGNGNSELNILPGTIYNTTYLDEGPYNITITVTDNITGCVREYVKNFFYGTNPAVSLGIPGNTQNQCSPKIYGFEATFSNNSGILNSPGTLYRKYTNDGKDDSTFIHPYPATDLLSDIIFHTFDEASCGYSSIAYDNSFLVGISATNGCGSSSAEVSPITQSSPPLAYIEMEDSIFCINSPVTFRDTSLGGKYVYGVNTGSGFTYECDTSIAVAWDFMPNTGFTVTSGSLGNYSGLQYFDGTTHGTTEIQVMFHNKGAYTVNFKKVSPCGNAEISDEDFKDFLIDSLPDAEFTLDKHIDCSPLFIYGNNTSKSLDDFSSVFDWTYSTLTVGCQGSAPPNINPAASDSTVFEIYDEDFSGQNGQGAFGTSSDLSNVNWNILVNNSTWNNDDWFYVKNERFEAVNVSSNNNDTAYWYSSVVDISEYQYIFTELKAFTNNSSGVKSIKSQYKLDGGLWTDFLNNGVLTGNFTSPSIVSADGINGNSIQLRVGINLSNSTDTIFFDDIEIFGYSIPDSLNTEYSFNLPGIYSIDLSATNVCGSDNFKDTVTAVGPPVLSIDNIIDTCDSKKLNPIATIDTCFGKMNTYNWSFPGSIANNISTLEIPSTILYDSVGVFKVYFNASNQCGLDSDSLEFEIHDNPVISLIELDSVCFGLSLGLSASVSEGSPNYNYLWSSVNALISNSTISNPVVTTTIDNTFFLEVTDINNCKGYDTILIDVLDLPTVNPGLNQSICPEDTAFLLGSISGAIPPYIFSWDSPFLSDQNILNPYYDMNGSKTFTLNVTDDYGCVNSNSVNITEFNSPVVITQLDTVICDLPVNVTLNASPTGGNWIDTNITNNGIYSPDGPGSFKIYYDYTDVNTCYNIDSMILTVNPAQIANAGPDIIACADTGLIILNGLPSTTGIWDGNGVDLVGNYNSSSANLNLVNENFAYNIGTGNCFTTDTMNLLINPLPVISLDNSFEICISAGDTTIQFSPSGGLLEGTGVFNSNTGLFSPTDAGVGTHKLIYSYENPITGCWNYDSLEITVNPLPNVNYIHDSIFCLNVGYQINNSTSEVQNHYWTISEGSFSNSYSPVFSIDTAGIFDINYIAETNRGCLDSASSIVEVLAPPLADYSAPDSGCGPIQVDFTNNSVGKYVSYLWDFGLVNYIGNDSISNDTTPSIHSYPAGIYFDTSYYTSLTVTNYCGISIKNLEIISMPTPVSRFASLSNVGGCGTSLITLANNSYGLPDNYYWDFGDGSFGTNSDTIFDKQYSPGPSIDFYTITMAVTNECGTDTTIETVTILPSGLVAFFSVDTTVGCLPFTLDFEQFSVGAATHSWDFKDGNFSNAYSPTHTFLDTGTFEVSLAVSNACDFDTAFKTIRVNTSPNVEFSVIDDTLCAGSTLLISNSSDLGINNNWNFGDNSSSFLTNPTHVFSDSGHYRVILIGTSLTNNCPASDSVDLVVLPYPEVTASSDTSNGCIPLPVNFSSTSNSVGYYLWDFGDGNSSGLANPNHTYTSDGYYSVNLRFEDLAGCVDSFDFDIIPYPVPQISFNPIQLDTCVLPASYTLQNNSIGASTNNWNFGDGSVSFINSPNYSYSAPGNYDINLLISNTYGCSDSTSQSIVVKPVPIADFNPIQLDTCILPVNYNLVNNSQGAIAYTWDFGDGNSSNLVNSNHSYNQDGNYQISLIAMNSVGCFDTSLISINILPVPDLSFNFDQRDTCTIPSLFSFQNNSNGATSYLWDFGDGLYSSLSSPFHTFNNAGTFNVQLSSTNIYGCSDTFIKPVTINPVPISNFNPIQLDTCILPANYSLVNNSTGSFINSWDLGDGSNSNSLNLNYSYLNSGTYNITLTTTNQFGCFDSSSKTVNVLSVPYSDFTYNKLDSCILPSNYSFTNNSTGSNTYMWTFDTIANSIQPNPFFTFNSDGVFEIKLLSINNSGCVDSSINYINVNPIISADFSTDTSIGCEPFNVIFNNNSQNSSFYNWDFGDGNTASFFNGFYEYQNAGNYIIKLVTEDINGCKDSIFESINVYPSPTSSYTYVASDPCYLPISVDFTNTSLLSNNFEWNFGNGQTSSIINPSTIFDSVGNYNIQLISGNSYNCYDTLNNFFDVVNKQVPIANFNFNDSICLRDTTFFNSTTLFADSLVWNLGNGIISYGDAISYVYDSSGRYTITLFAFNTGSGCSDTLQSINSLDVLSAPVADFNFNQIQSDEPLSGSLEFINNSTAADSYFWDFANIDSTSEEYPTYYYRYDFDGTYYYTLYAFNNYGCVDSLTKDLYIFYEKTLFIPNALYPSSNKFEVANFIPKGTGMKRYKIEIFDLFGNLIWESSLIDDEGKPTEYWDGKFNGQDVETDTYVWKVEAQFKDDSFWGGQQPLEEKIYRKTGTLTVIR